MELTVEQKEKIEEVGEEFNLKLIVIYGSYAKETSREGSDLDIAYLSSKPLDLKTEFKLHARLEDIFKCSRKRELDLKSLHRTDPFFRYQVMKDAQLIYGDFHLFHRFKNYAVRFYQEAHTLRKLKDTMVKKNQEYLNETYVG